jgi:hypothetical protein
LLVLAARGIVATIGAIAGPARTSRWLFGGAIAWCITWVVAAWLWAEPL